MSGSTARNCLFGCLALTLSAAGCWSDKAGNGSAAQPLSCPTACLPPPATIPYWVSSPTDPRLNSLTGPAIARTNGPQPSATGSAPPPATAAATMWPGIEAMPPRAPQSMVVSPPTAASTTVRTTALRSVVVSFGAERQTAMQAATRRQSLPDPQTPGNPQIVALPPMVSDLSITATATGREPAEPVRQASAAVDAPPAIGPPAIPLENVQLAAAGAPAAEPIPAPHPRRLEVPPELPGANAPQIRLPPLDREHAAERAAAVAKLFPPLPPLGAEYQATALPQGTPLTLDDLEQMARQYSPDLRQAMANVRSAEGAMIQAGLYPNPTVGYESDDVGQGLTAGQQGGFVDQTIKTGGKLQLAKAAAEMDVANAQVALRKAQSGLAAKVRGAYFSTLVAEENVRVSHALARFSDEAYNVQVDMVKGGQAAAYEPLQLRVLAYQARASLVQARNRYVSAWKQLAAAMGVPGMPPAPLAGRVDAPVPLVRYDAALAHILATNSDVLTAENTLHQSQINLRLAQVNRIPDLDAHVVVERDYTTPPFGTIVGVQLGGPLPLWDHNQGNIMAAEAAVTKASEGPHFARDDLTSRLADAYERYQDNMKVIEIYRKWMLPDQVQAYRGAYQRHQTEPDVVAFADVVTAQQTLATTITSYVTQLGTLWQAVVDMGSLLEAEDLFHMGDPQNLPPVPDLAALCPLPCCHAYQPAAAAGWLGGDAQWPALAPGEKPTR